MFAQGPPLIPALRPRFASNEGSGRGLPGGIVKDERGMYYTWLSLIMLPLALLVLFMFIDVQRVQVVRGQEMLMADSAALAAASTATPVAEYTYVYVYDNGGNVIGIEGDIVDVKAVIEDPVLAESEARRAALKNMGSLANQANAGMFDLNVSLAPGTADDFQGQKVKDDTYAVRIKSSLDTFYANALNKLYGLPGGGKEEGATAYAQAVLQP